MTDYNHPDDWLTPIMVQVEMSRHVPLGSPLPSTDMIREWCAQGVIPARRLALSRYGIAVADVPLVAEHWMQVRGLKR